MPAVPSSPRSSPRRPGRPGRAPLWRAVTSLLVVGLALWAALSLTPGSASTCAAAPRSCWRPRTPPASRPTPSPPTARSRCCAAGSTRSASPSRPWPGPASAGSSSSCPACRTPARPPRSSAGPRSSASTRSSAARRAPARSRPAAPRRPPDETRPSRSGSARSSSPATASRTPAPSSPTDRHRPVGRQRRLQRRRRPAVGARWCSGLRPARDRRPAGRDRARQRGHLLPAVEPGALRSGTAAATQITGSFTAGRGQGPGRADQGRRPAGARRGHRAAHRRRRPSVTPPIEAQRRGRADRRRPDRAVHHRGLPADRGCSATVALGSLRADLLRRCWSALGATLTLPGLAGFVLAIGMAIDANVLVFERAREEYAAAAGDGLAARARPPASGKAWSAIIDSNVTTLLAAGLLFFLASGPVRGFGVTLVHRRARLDGLRAGHHPGAGRLGGAPAGSSRGGRGSPGIAGTGPGAHLAGRSATRT